MSTISNEQTFQVLNELIQLNKDSAKGFKRVAAEMRDVEDPERAQRLEALVKERAQIVDDLQQAVADLGRTPESKGSATNAIRRGWLNIKGAMTIEHGKTKKVVLNDRLDQEESVLEAYGSALDHDLPSDVHTLLEKQQAAIIEQRERLLSIKEPD